MITLFFPMVTHVWWWQSDNISIHTNTLSSDVIEFCPHIMPYVTLIRALSWILLPASLHHSRQHGCRAFHMLVKGISRIYSVGGQSVIGTLSDNCSEVLVLLSAPDLTFCSLLTCKISHHILHMQKALWDTLWQPSKSGGVNVFVKAAVFIIFWSQFLQIIGNWASARCIIWWWISNTLCELKVRSKYIILPHAVSKCAESST